MLGVGSKSFDLVSSPTGSIKSQKRTLKKEKNQTIKPSPEPNFLEQASFMGNKHVISSKHMNNSMEVERGLKDIDERLERGLK